MKSSNRVVTFLSLVLALTAIAVAGCADTATPPVEVETAAAGAEATFEDPERFHETFRSMDAWFATRRIEAPPEPSPLVEAEEGFDLRYRFGDAEYTVEDFVERTDGTGLLVLDGDRVLYEGYFQGADEESLFTSWSVAKSFVSTLVGLARADGRIASLEDPVTDYLPELLGSGYEGVAIRDVLQMSSGIDFVEEYEDPEADIARLWGTAVTDEERVDEVAASFASRGPAGESFYYASNDTQVLGMLVRRVWDDSLAAVVESELWRPLGMEGDALWITDVEGEEGVELAFCCLNARLRDYGRFGLLMARDGIWHGERVLPEDWVAEATVPAPAHLRPGQLYADRDYPLGYGYQWWVLPRPAGAFTGQGVYGQFLLVSPEHDLVVVKTSAWPVAWDEEKEAETYAFFEAVVEAWGEGAR